MRGFWSCMFDVFAASCCYRRLVLGVFFLWFGSSVCFSGFGCDTAAVWLCCGRTVMLFWPALVCNFVLPFPSLSSLLVSLSINKICC